MFRNSEKGVFIPSHDYFDHEILYYNIAQTGAKFPDFPRTMEDYIQSCLKQGFTLMDFVENKPKQEWKKQDPMFVKIPYLCFQVWRKK
jgi:hypothetical protein